MRLIAEGLGGERGGRVVFSNVDFVLERGQALVVTGPNGTGKSTLLRIIAGLLPPSSGAARLENSGDPFETIASAAHFLGALNAMKATLTVRENLSFWRGFAGSDVGIDEALGRVGLEGVAHLPFGYLSTGQRRRASIARLIVSHRPIWLLDEPTAGLDAASERQFAVLMASHLQSGGMIVAATHLPLGIEGAAEMRMGELGHA
jgi:heme exporter protein A